MIVVCLFPDPVQPDPADMGPVHPGGRAHHDVHGVQHPQDAPAVPHATRLRRTHRTPPGE